MLRIPQVRRVYHTLAVYKNKISARDSKDTLLFVHVGKCAGASAFRAILHTGQDKFKRVYKFHVAAPPIHKKSKYIFVVRNPVNRVVSAICWRKRILEEGRQSNFYPGEAEFLLGPMSGVEILEEYLRNNQNDIGLRVIHHYRQGLHYHLNQMLQKISREQIECCLVQETLDECLKNKLGYQNVEKIHQNSGSSPTESLSTGSRQKLRGFLSRDYEIIDKLYNLNCLTQKQYALLQE